MRCTWWENLDYNGDRLIVLGDIGKWIFRLWFFGRFKKVIIRLWTLFHWYVLKKTTHLIIHQDIEYWQYPNLLWYFLKAIENFECL